MPRGVALRIVVRAQEHRAEHAQEHRRTVGVNQPGQHGRGAELEAPGRLHTVWSALQQKAKCALARLVGFVERGETLA